MLTILNAIDRIRNEVRELKGVKPDVRIGNDLCGILIAVEWVGVPTYRFGRVFLRREIELINCPDVLIQYFIDDCNAAAAEFKP